MPSHVCSICHRTEFYSSRVSALHSCQVCHRQFCKQCAAAYFLCVKCEADLPAGVKDSLVAALAQPKRTMDITLKTSGLGAILLPTTFIVVAIISATHAYPLFFLPAIQAIAGVMMLISSAAVRYSARMTMRQAAYTVLRPYARGFYQGDYYGPQPSWPQPAPQYQQQYPLQYQPVQQTAPPAPGPSLPNSAFLPNVQEIPHEPAKTSAKGRTVPASIDDTGPPKSRFCGLCGHALPDISDLIFCPECGQKIE